MSPFTLMFGATATSAVVFIVLGVITMIRGTMPRRPNLPSRAVRYGAGAFTLLGTWSLLASLPYLIGLHPGPRITLETAGMALIPAIVALHIRAAAITSRYRQAREPGGPQDQRVHAGFNWGAKPAHNAEK